MDHPFQVGKMYRNRTGEYEVVQIDGPRMTIRYTDGSLLSTSVAIQARIWENIQFDAAAARAEQRTAVLTARRRASRRGLDFTGLQDHDFQYGTAGTSWRARNNLGGRLAQHLSDATARHFESFAIFRRPVVHLAQPEHYGAKTKWRQAKYSFELSESHARYGLYIEKNEGPMDTTWHWPNMVSALTHDQRLVAGLDTAMREHSLNWEVYVWADGGLVAEVKSGEVGLLWKQAKSKETEAISWTTFVQRLCNIDEQKWVDLLLLGDCPKDKALAAGTDFPRLAVDVYLALLPLYDACTGTRKTR